MSDCVKVGYRLKSGFVSTAYGYQDGDTVTGEDKYTGEPVTVRWNGEEWILQEDGDGQ